MFSLQTTFQAAMMLNNFDVIVNQETLNPWLSILVAIQGCQSKIMKITYHDFFRNSRDEKFFTTFSLDSGKETDSLRKSSTFSLKVFSRII